MTSYDNWKTDDRLEDAPLHRNCFLCAAPTQNVFEEYAGLCRQHLAEEELREGGVL